MYMVRWIIRRCLSLSNSSLNFAFLAGFRYKHAARKQWKRSEAWQAAHTSQRNTCSQKTFCDLMQMKSTETENRRMMITCTGTCAPQYRVLLIFVICRRGKSPQWARPNRWQPRIYHRRPVCIDRYFPIVFAHATNERCVWHAETIDWRRSVRRCAE